MAKPLEIVFRNCVIFDRCSATLEQVGGLEGYPKGGLIDAGLGMDTLWTRLDTLLDSFGLTLGFYTFALVFSVSR